MWRFTHHPFERQPATAPDQRSVRRLRALVLLLGFMPWNGWSADRDPAADAQMLGLWPPPPAEPRIAFVQSITGPADLGITPSSWAKVVNWFTGGNPDKQKMVKPFGVALDEADNLCVTDMGTGLVWFFDRARKRCSLMGYRGKAPFVSPVAVARRDGVTYVADSALRTVTALSAEGKSLYEISQGLERPAGLAVSANQIFVADSARHCVVVFDRSGKELRRIGNRGAGEGELNYPSHLALGKDHRLLVTDSLNSRISIFGATGSFLNTVGSAGDGTGHLGRPKGVAMDSFGHVYVMDALFDNLQIFDDQGHFLLSVGTTGSKAGEFWLPAGVALTRSNEIFIADSYNKRIQVFKYLDKP
jgi:DNA-binding beta-propeller fold protein YncE